MSMVRSWMSVVLEGRPMRSRTVQEATTLGQSPVGTAWAATNEQQSTADIPRLAVSVDEVAAMLGLSRAKAYEAVRLGEIPSVRIGRRILIPRHRLEQLLNGADPIPDVGGLEDPSPCHIGTADAQADEAG